MFKVYYDNFYCLVIVQIGYILTYSFVGIFAPQEHVQAGYSILCSLPFSLFSKALLSVCHTHTLVFCFHNNKNACHSKMEHLVFQTGFCSYIRIPTYVVTFGMLPVVPLAIM